MIEKCIACGASAFILVGKVKRCGTCGLGVTIDEASNGYSNYHRDTVYVKASSQFRNIFARRVDILLRFVKAGKALEVGSSTGLLLSLLKEKGWEVLGVEPSSKAGEEANKRGIKTLKTTFESAKLPKEYFDAVIFNHVLEHVASPQDTLEKAKNVLKNGGVVLIDIPNFGSLSAKLRGAGWKYLLPEEHRWHFTKGSLDKLLAKSGFKIIYWEAHSGIWGYGSPFLELGESLTGGKKRFFGEALTLIPTYFITKLKLGTGLTVVAQKVK